MTISLMNHLSNMTIVSNFSLEQNKSISETVVTRVCRQLPDVTLRISFQFLDLKSLIQCESVCRQYNRVSLSSWRFLKHRHGVDFDWEDVDQTIAGKQLNQASESIRHYLRASKDKWDYLLVDTFFIFAKTMDGSFKFSPCVYHRVEYLTHNFRQCGYIFQQTYPTLASTSTAENSEMGSMREKLLEARERSPNYEISNLLMRWFLFRSKKSNPSLIQEERRKIGAVIANSAHLKFCSNDFKNAKYLYAGAVDAYENEVTSDVLKAAADCAYLSGDYRMAILWYSRFIESYADTKADAESIKILTTAVHAIYLMKHYIKSRKGYEKVNVSYNRLITAHGDQLPINILEEMIEIRQTFKDYVGGARLHSLLKKRKVNSLI